MQPGNKQNLQRMESTVSYNAEMDQHDELFEQMLEFEQSLEEMVLLESAINMNLSTLKTKRRINNLLPETGFGSPKSNGEIRLASLEVPSVPNDDIWENTQHKFPQDPTVETSSKELISYFVLLGKSDNTDDVDYSFLDTLLSLADIHSTDIHGQSIMHEVAREWHPDLAYFLKVKGINIDMEDKLGRTPLYVAVAANYTEMVSWLIKNGANIHHRTIQGEGQTPIHFAAKYDAVEAFQVLMENGANLLEKDEHNRDPFFLAAQVGNIRICRYMLELELPTACYSDCGEATIDHILVNLPVELAERALNQFVGINQSTGNIKLYLSCLGKRRWKLLSKSRDSVALITGTTPPNPLEIVTRKGILKLVTHPVMLKLIKLKYEKVGKRLIQLNITLHLIFTLLWTCAVSIRTPEHIHGDTIEKHIILGLTLLAQVLTFVFIYKLIREYTSLRQVIEDERKRLLYQYERMKIFCHPRWRMDTAMLNKMKDKADIMRTEFWKNGWTIIEALCLLMASINTIITIVWYILTSMEKETVLPHVRMYYSAIFVIIVWMRLNRSFRSHRSFGPFVAMLGQCVMCSVKIGFLFFEFFIPLAVTCWVMFGGDRSLYKSPKDKKELSVEYEKLNDLLYQLYLLSFGGDYDYDTLKGIRKTLSQIFVGIYFVLLTIITINIYIALLSEAVARVIATATERADLEEADSCGKVERTFPQLKLDFEIYLDKYCSPLEIHVSDFKDTNTLNTRRVVSDASKTVIAVSQTVHSIIQEQILAKKDLLRVNETMQNFGEKYSQEEMGIIKKKISAIIEYQLRPIVKAAKKTDDGITKYMNKLKGNLPKI